MNLALRFVLELCVLAAIGYWGFATGKGALIKILLGIVIPLIIAIVWGTFGAPKAAMLLTGWTHLILEVVVFGLGVLALIYVGRIRLAILFGVIIVINKIFMYIWHQ